MNTNTLLLTYAQWQMPVQNNEGPKRLNMKMLWSLKGKPGKHAMHITENTI